MIWVDVIAAGVGGQWQLFLGVGLGAGLGVQFGRWTVLWCMAETRVTVDEMRVRRAERQRERRMRVRRADRRLLALK